eukprot:1985782-Pyramimonas_sp.AAC.1
MKEAVNAPPDQLATEEVNGKWDLPYYARKKMARSSAMNLKRIYQEHQCDGDCNHASQWDRRI